jgi:hypothetical protein
MFLLRFLRRSALSVLITALLPGSLLAQTARKSLRTGSFTTQIVIDGRLTEPVWHRSASAGTMNVNVWLRTMTSPSIQALNEVVALHPILAGAAISPTFLKYRCLNLLPYPNAI